jgi:hypothetical protein
MLWVEPGQRGVGDGLQVTQLVASATPHRSGRRHNRSVMSFAGNGTQSVGVARVDIDWSRTMAAF